MFTSEQLTEGEVYTRAYLRQTFSIHNATLNTGIFQPSGHKSIWLFITENKTKNLPQYLDFLRGDMLVWEGQTQGRTDRLIIEHETKGIELLVFYRIHKRAGGFRYEGKFRYIRHAGSHPTLFILQRIFNDAHVIKNSVVVSEIEVANEKVMPSYYLTSNQEQHGEREQPRVVAEQSEQIKLVYCYARKDKRFRDALDNQLSVLKHIYHIVTWFDYEISPGIDWEKEINTQINSANIILLLVSPDFMASKYCYGVEMRRAIERHERGEAKVIPIILRPISWQDTPLGKLQALPRNGKTVIDRSWHGQVNALEDIEKDLKKVLNQLLSINGNIL